MGESGPLALVKNSRVFLIAAFATIGGVLYGYNQGMFSGVLAMPSFQSRELSLIPLGTYWNLGDVNRYRDLDMGEYDPVDPNADQTKKGWLTSILELGAWLGTLLSGFLAEAISRKYGILVAVIVFVLGVVIQTTAISVGYQAILAGRFITYDPMSFHKIILMC
jgi:MFS family permease